jgi:mono/diheme cytochrome c family protein
MKTTKWMLIILTAVLALMVLAACWSSATATPDPNAAKPSNSGGTGEALKLTGNASNGATIFTNTCATCHGPEGKGGVANEGSTDGTVPALNPIDETLVNSDPKVFAANLDLFLEHGSTPEGSSPSKVMLAYGDLKVLQPQQIADVIAYIISLNKK